MGKMKFLFLSFLILHRIQTAPCKVKKPPKIASHDICHGCGYVFTWASASIPSLDDHWILCSPKTRIPRDRAYATYNASLPCSACGLSKSQPSSGTYFNYKNFCYLKFFNINITKPRFNRYLHFEVANFWKCFFHTNFEWLKNDISRMRTVFANNFLNDYFNSFHLT